MDDSGGFRPGRNPPTFRVSGVIGVDGLDSTYPTRYFGSIGQTGGIVGEFL